MEWFKLILDRRESSIPRELAYGMQGCSELDCSHHKGHCPLPMSEVEKIWAALVDAMGINVDNAPTLKKRVSVEEALDAIIKKAVPEEGIQYPHRPTWKRDGDVVTIEIENRKQETEVLTLRRVDHFTLEVRYDFGCYNALQATWMLAGFARRSYAARCLLGKAAGELALISKQYHNPEYCDCG